MVYIKEPKTRSIFVVFVTVRVGMTVVKFCSIPELSLLLKNFSSHSNNKSVFIQCKTTHDKSHVKYYFFSYSLHFICKVHFPFFSSFLKQVTHIFVTKSKMKKVTWILGSLGFYMLHLCFAIRKKISIK